MPIGHPVPDFFNRGNGFKCPHRFAVFISASSSLKRQLIAPTYFNTRERDDAIAEESYRKIRPAYTARFKKERKANRTSSRHAEMPYERALVLSVLCGALLPIYTSAITSYRTTELPDRGYKAFSREYSLNPDRFERDDSGI